MGPSLGIWVDMDIIQRNYCLHLSVTVMCYAVVISRSGQDKSVRLLCITLHNITLDDVTMVCIISYYILFPCGQDLPL